MATFRCDFRPGALATYVKSTIQTLKKDNNYWLFKAIDVEEKLAKAESRVVVGDRAIARLTEKCSELRLENDKITNINSRLCGKIDELRRAPRHGYRKSQLEWKQDSTGYS
jgi:transcriptional regulator NrdR family protein